MTRLGRGERAARLRYAEHCVRRPPPNARRREATPEQAPSDRLHAHFTEARARIVVSDGAVEPRIDAADFRDVEQKIRQFVRLCTQTPDALEFARVIGE